MAVLMFFFVDFQVGDPTPAADSGLPVREPGERQFHSEGSWILRLKNHGRVHVSK